MTPQNKIHNADLPALPPRQFVSTTDLCLTKHGLPNEATTRLLAGAATAEAAGGTTLTAVSALTGSLVKATAHAAGAAATGAGGQGSGTLRLHQRVGDDLLGQVQVLAQELNALIGEEVVAPLPAEGVAAVAARDKALHLLHDVQVGHVGHLVVRRLLGVLLDSQAPILEQGGVNGNAVGLGHHHLGH